MKIYESINQLIFDQAEKQPQATAVEALNRPALSYGRLAQHLRETAAQLQRLGLSSHSRVAIVLPNGPEMATAFVAVAAAAACAPLNPNYRAEEFRFYLADLEVEALIVPADWQTPAVEVARELAIPIIELDSDPDGAAGLFTLHGSPGAPSIMAEAADPDRICMLLHTSGTTSRPKIVPLSQRNLCLSAANIVKALSLTPADRCLNVMPLFHIHGLIAAVLSSLQAGAAIICTPGFYAADFFTWMKDFAPTWYTAVPTMHQAILSRTEANQEIIAQSRLRFLRSASASLPPQVMQALEETFQAPMIEAYGMTEMAHQIASNPLPPGRRKAGSVGQAAGPEVAIMAETEDRFLPQGETGEIVLRGGNLIAGYANNPEANQKAFTADGWFRTGDQGYLDEEGYLFITGCLKEIINRGGEKISPREVDEVLMAYLGVAQALSFAMPDSWLGEDVAAAVVLENNVTVAEGELRRYAAGRLADFKVPRTIIFLDEIPKGPTGKLQRIGLAERLGVHGEALQEQAAEPFVAPRDELEHLLADLWIEVLNLEEIGVLDTFLARGGDSLSATRLPNRIRSHFDIELSMIDFYDAPTIADQAKLITVHLSG